MHTVSVRELDGSLVIAVPAEVAEELHLQAGGEVRINAEGGHLGLYRKRSKYTLSELLADCDPTQPISAEEQEWMQAAPTGREIQDR